jgi:UDPglucose--hexose-1-phosphate uridylyltransferase
MEAEPKKPASELRFNLISKDWVVIATGRARRPETFATQQREKHEVSEKECFFCNLGSQEKPVLEYKNENGDWEVTVVPNKFPAFSCASALHERTEGIYSLMDGVGFHEVVITRDHRKSLAEFSVSQIRKVIDAYQERYLDLANEKFVNYIAIFHNHGREAGASVFHPHSQIIAMPLIDPDLQRSLNGSRIFFETRGECAHCKMIDWDIKDGRRIIFENEKFVVLVPFASRVAFEVRIYPKEHHAYFERIKEADKNLLAQAFKEALSRVFKGMNDPSYNFFLHTAPPDGRDYNHYHWHFEILPKTSTWAGFELGTGIEISTVQPEEAAKYLREIKN